MDDFEGSSRGDLSAADSLGEEEALSFEPVLKMPTGRLQDILDAIQKKEMGVVNLDAVLPAGEAGVPVLQTMLHFMKPSVKTLSVRFNSLHQTAREVLVEWIATNAHLETLYIMGAGFDEALRARLETAWGKNLTSHRTDNMGMTFIRVPESAGPPPEDE